MTLLQWRASPSYGFYLLCLIIIIIIIVYIYIYETTTIFQNIGVQALTFKLTLLEKLKSCINTMESTDTASIQWTIMYRSYQVIVALDV